MIPVILDTMFVEHFEIFRLEPRVVKLDRLVVIVQIHPSQHGDEARARKRLRRIDIGAPQGSDVGQIMEHGGRRGRLAAVLPRSPVLFGEQLAVTVGKPCEAGHMKLIVILCAKSGSGRRPSGPRHDRSRRKGP